MNTAQNIEKLNSELKNANCDDVFGDENPDSAYVFTIEKSQTKNY